MEWRISSMHLAQLMQWVVGMPAAVNSHHWRPVRIIATSFKWIGMPRNVGSPLPRASLSTELRTMPRWVRVVWRQRGVHLSSACPRTWSTECQPNLQHQYSIYLSTNTKIDGCKIAERISWRSLHKRTRRRALRRWIRIVKRAPRVCDDTHRPSTLHHSGRCPSSRRFCRPCKRFERTMLASPLSNTTRATARLDTACSAMASTRAPRPEPPSSTVRYVLCVFRVLFVIMRMIVLWMLMWLLPSFFNLFV